MLNLNTRLRNNMLLAWPLALNALLVQSMLMIDTLLVAPLGAVPVAAMGIASTIVAFALGIEIAISNGIQLLVARAAGSNNKHDLALTFWSGQIITAIAACALFCVLALFGEHIAALISTNQSVTKQAAEYLDVTKYIVLLSAYTQVCTAFCNGRGDTQIPLKGFALELPVNIVASYVLINGLAGFAGIGLVGAAWGSLVAVLVRTLFLMFAVHGDKNIDVRYPTQASLPKVMMLHLSEIVPIAANFFVLYIGATVYLLLYAQLPLYSYVAITLIFPWIRAATQFPNSWAQASAISISQSIGEKNTAELALFVQACVRIGMYISLVIAALLLLLSWCVSTIYPAINSDTIAALALIAPLYIVLPIVRAYNTVSGNVLRALGNSKRVLHIHLVTQWLISLPICTLLVLYFEVSIFWAFAMIPLEELFKTFPFYHYKKRLLSRQ